MCGSVHRGVFSTLGEYHEYIGGVKYIGGYHECMGRGISWIHWGISWCKWGIPWVHWGMFSTSGDIMSTLGDIMSTLEDIMSTLGFSIEIERIYQVAPLNASWYPSDVLNISQCTHDIPSPNVLMISLPSNVLMVFLRCTEHPPMYWTSPDVHMVSPHIHNDIPWCTEHPLMYWISPKLMNTHYTRWTFYWWIVWHIWNTTVIFLLLPW